MTPSIHTAASWLSLGLAVLLLLSVVSALRSRSRSHLQVVDVVAQSGAVTSLLALVTGPAFSEFGGRGAWWVWDLPFALEFTLLALFAGVTIVRATTAREFP